MFFLVLALSGFVIGFVGGIIGLVLGVVRYPVIMSVESSVGIAAGTNLGVSTLGAITAAIRHYRQKNVQFRAFVFLATTGAVGAFIGSFLTGYVPIALLLIAIGLIVSYESFLLLGGSRILRKNDSSIKSFNVIGPTTNDGILVQSKNRLILLESLIGLGVGFLGGLVGLILGSILMPAMISILKMEPKVAVGTNLAAASVMGISGVDRTFHK